MLDIQFIRENPDLVKEKSAQKQVKVNVDELLKLDVERRGYLTRIEELRQKRNEHSSMSVSPSVSPSPSESESISSSPSASPSASAIAEGRQLKEQLVKLEHELESTDKKYFPLLKSVPNMALDDVPVGKSEADNVVTKEVGAKHEFDFEPKSHVQLATAKDLIDKQRAAKVAGARFAYLKGGLVELQFALVQFVLTTLGDEKILERIIHENKLDIVAKPFVPVIPPALVRTEAYEATERLNAEETTYKLADDELWLNASAEHSIANMYQDEILAESELPIRYIGYSTSFRREAGSYGKDLEGIMRMHQFDKLEMEVFSTPGTGLQEHLFLIALQEYFMQQLGLPYRVLNKCTADIGLPNARGVDIEAWIPSQKEYRETHTADYMTDFQARSLKTRYRSNFSTETGPYPEKLEHKLPLVQFVHTNDATALAMPRTLIAIMENNQTHDGHMMIPEVLKPYLKGKSEI